METKIYYKKNTYIDKKTGVEKTAYNYIAVYGENEYLNIQPTFKDDYFQLNHLRKIGKIVEYETKRKD